MHRDPALWTLPGRRRCCWRWGIVVDPALIAFGIRGVLRLSRPARRPTRSTGGTARCSFRC